MKWTLSRKNNTFDLVELLKGRKILKNNWVIKLKQDNYKLVKHKAHSNLKGFGQNENFSLVIKSSSIWVVLDLATSLNLEIEHLDVKIDFLHWDFIEEIYMEQLGVLRERNLTIVFRPKWSTAPIVTATSLANKIV